MFQDWSLLVKLNQRNHRTGNETWKGETLVRRGSNVLASKPLFSKDLLCARIFNSYWCYSTTTELPKPCISGIQGLRKLVVDFLQLQTPWQTLLDRKGKTERIWNQRHVSILRRRPRWGSWTVTGSKLADFCLFRRCSWTSTQEGTPGRTLFRPAMGMLSGFLLSIKVCIVKHIQCIPYEEKALISKAGEIFVYNFV